MNSPKWGRSRRMTETTGTTTATTAVTSTPFHAGREGYASFRIPAPVVLDTGRILLVHARASTDGGTTWRPAYETITFRRIPVTALT